MTITILEPGQAPYRIVLESFQDLGRMKLTDEERYHIIILYHQANNKLLYKNAETTINNTTYGVSL